MAKFLIIHSPAGGEESAVRQPSKLAELARAHGTEEASPRWLSTWSPDLEDDRIFSLWEARNSAEIDAVLQRYGFLDDMSSQALRVREWGPQHVLEAEGDRP
jgi:hypothetical protein